MTAQNNKPIIEVKHLSKQYQIGADRTYKRFTENATNIVRHPLRTIREAAQPKDIFWALKDINFEVKHGEVLGIIGRNGAGKSTLLKVLSRITRQTEGEIVVRGRIGSLLEVGTGFHPELTGRENIYFNGAILGMKKREIDDKFDEIVKFSGIEKFLDTPVKRYSSGMQVRLAFSVAAHLDPEILLVDEVLAVGDAEFQKKCMGKMGEIAGEGRTVLFVSHNMAAVQNLCNSAFLMNNGKIIEKGDTDSIISFYLSHSHHEGIVVENGVFDLSKRVNQYNNGKPIIKRVILLGSDDVVRSTFLTGEKIKIAILVEGLPEYPGSHLGVVFKTGYDQWVSTATTWMSHTVIEQPRRNKEWAILEINNLCLTPGKWTLYLSSTIHGHGVYLDKIENSVSFTVEGSDYYGTGQLITNYYGLFCMDFNWKIVHDVKQNIEV
ncbi:MAG: ABC transporter ATP-binding protein [Eubacteriales bacterium]|nr:ABC transporter ATP-binding protein [Eubacteriales bacterium]